MSQNPPTVSPTGWKTHHFAILASIGIAAVEAAQGYTGQTVNLSDPVVWGQFFAFAMTIVGLIRNKPQGQTIK